MKVLTLCIFLIIGIGTAHSQNCSITSCDFPFKFNGKRISAETAQGKPLVANDTIVSSEGPIKIEFSFGKRIGHLYLPKHHRF